MNMDEQFELEEQCQHLNAQNMESPCEEIEGNVDIVEYCPMCESFAPISCKPKEKN